MANEFDPPLARPNITGLKLKADGSRMRVCVILECADGEQIDDVVHIEPEECPQQLRDWVKAKAVEKIREKYGAAD